MGKSLWLVCSKAALLTASKGNPVKMKAVSVCNLQLVNGFLADPEGMKVFYLCLSLELLLDCQTRLQLWTACPWRYLLPRAS